MNLKTTIVLTALLIAGLVGWLVFSLQSTQEALGPTNAFLRDKLTADDLTRVEIDKGTSKVVLQRKDAKSSWYLPGKWPVRQREVSDLIDTLAQLHSRFEPTAFAKDEDLKKFGLESAPLTIKVTLASDKEHTLQFGNEPAEDNRFSRPTFMRLDDLKEVVRLAPGLIATLGRSQEYFQQRRLFPYERVARESDSFDKVEQVDASEIKVKSADGTYEIVEKNDNWQLQQPVVDRVDPEKLKSLLRAIPDIWAERFVDQKDRKLDDLGLNPPETTVTAVGPGGEAIELLVGKVSRVDMRKVKKDAPPPQFGQPPMPKFDVVKVEYRYAKLRDNDQIFEIKADKLGEVALSVEKLRDPKLARFEPDEVKKIEIRQPDGKLVLVKDGDVWKLTEPVALAAESTQVTELLGKLSGLEATAKDVIDGADLKKLGLAKPGEVVTIEVEDKDKKQKKYTFEFARDEKEKDKSLVLVAGWPRVNIVSDDVYKLVERPALAYRTRKLLDVAVKDIERIEVKRGSETFTFSQAKDTWRLTAPVNSDVDPTKVGLLASDLSRLEAVEFVETSPKAETLKKFGLAAPKLEVDISLDGKKSHKLAVGVKREGKDDYYARLDDGPVFVLGKELETNLDRDSLSYRNDKLWNLEAEKINEVVVHKNDPEYVIKRKGMNEGWEVTGPFSAPAANFLAKKLVDQLAQLKAEKFVAHLTKDLTKFGLEKPYLRVRIPPLEKDGKDHTLVVGGKVDKGEGRYARTSDTEAVFILGDKTLADIDRSALEFLDRSVLTLDPGKIAEVKFKGTDAFKLEEKAGMWKVTDSPAPAFTADTFAVQDFLGSLSVLRADKVAAYGAKTDLAVFGLEKPATSITIVVKAEEKREELKGPEPNPLEDKKDAGKEDKQSEGKKDAKDSKDTKAKKDDKKAAEPKTKTHKLELGKSSKDGGVYARLDGGLAVFELDNAVLKKLKRSHLDFVDTELLKYDIDTVKSITRKMQDNDFEIVKKDDMWVMQKPDRPADILTVESLLEKTFRLRALRIAAYPAKDLAMYGLDNPVATITLKLADPFGKNSEHVIKVGKESASPKGNSKDNEIGGRYAIVDKGDMVGVLPPALAKLLVSPTLNFTNRNLVNLTGIDEIVMKRDGREVNFTKKLDEWKMTGPTVNEAEKVALEDLLRDLSRLRADEMVADKVDAKKYKLDEPVVEWKLKSANKEVLHLLVGAEKADEQGRRYARIAARDLVFLLSPTVSERVLKEYRSRDVWESIDTAQVSKLIYKTPEGPFLLMKVGKEWKSLSKPGLKINDTAVTETLDALARLRAKRYVADAKPNLQLYGLKPALWTIQVDTPAGKRTLEVGRAVGTSKDYYAHVADSESVFILDEPDAALILRHVDAFAVQEPKDKKDASDKGKTDKGKTDKAEKK